MVGDHFHNKFYMEHAVLKDIQEEEEEKLQQIANYKKESIALSSSTEELESILIIQLYVPHAIVYDKRNQKCLALEPRHYTNHFYNAAIKIFQKVKFLGFIRVYNKE